MKINFSLVWLFLLIFCSCKGQNESPKVHRGNITDNENRGINEILDVYGGICEYGMDIKKSIGAKTQTSFWIKLSKSQALDTLQTTPYIPASNVALLFYKNLGIEKDRYTAVSVETIFNDKSSKKSSFTFSELEKVNRKLSLVNDIVNTIKEKQFGELEKYIAPSELDFFHEQKVAENIAHAETIFGKIQSFRLFGFYPMQRNDGREYLHVTGAIIRDHRSTLFSVNLDLNSPKNEVYTFNYKP